MRLIVTLRYASSQRSRNALACNVARRSHIIIKKQIKINLPMLGFDPTPFGLKVLRSKLLCTTETWS